jgi:predicted cupin superfamily sugar epimerase
MSRFHRVLHDEVWNHYEGAPLQLIQLHDKTLTQKTIGSEEEGYVDIVPAGNYQAAVSTGDYSLVGCTVAPGFDFEDFSFIYDASIALWLDTYHPSMSKFI